MHRRTAMKVKGGRALRKNNWTADRGDYWLRPQNEIRIDRRPPAHGCRHLVTVAQLRGFIGLLPVWDEVAVNLDAIVLSSRGGDTMGWAGTGIVALCGWEHGLWWSDGDAWFVDEHRALLDLLEVQMTRRRGGRFEIRWTEAQARAFQLLHILPHELGHHHDLITSRRQATMGRGEPYAEAYANRVLDELWPVYADRFGI